MPSLTVNSSPPGSYSRAVDPGADAGRVAAVLTRTTIAVVAVTALPVFVLGPYLVRTVYGARFADAGVALRFILPGVIAYSVVAVLTRYITGRGRPGTATLIMATGLAVNVTANLMLVPRLGIDGAALSSSISYVTTALVTIAVFRRLSGASLADTLLIKRSDVLAVGVVLRGIARRGARIPVPESSAAVDLVLSEHEPGEEA